MDTNGKKRKTVKIIAAENFFMVSLLWVRGTFNIRYFNMPEFSVMSRRIEGGKFGLNLLHSGCFLKKMLMVLTD